MHTAPTLAAAAIGRQLKVARQLLRVTQHQAAAAIERPFRSLLKAEAGDANRAGVARILRDLYERNGVAFGEDGGVSLKQGATPGLNVPAAPRTTLVGDVNGANYQIEIEGDDVIIGIWRQVTETHGRRAGTTYWMLLYGQEHPERRAQRKLLPVIAEAQAGLARARAKAAAAAPGG
jgi:hypothetical protein